MLLFEWNSDKAKKNIKVHNVSFEEASTAFRDTLSLTIYDPLHSDKEDRIVILGNSYKNHLLVTVFTERLDRIRIISSRIATKTERIQYEENAKRQ